MPRPSWNPPLVFRPRICGPPTPTTHSSMLARATRSACSLAARTAFAAGPKLRDQALAHSRRLHRRRGRDSATPLVHIGRQHARPRAADIEHHNQVVLLLAHGRSPALRRSRPRHAGSGLCFPGWRNRTGCGGGIPLRCALRSGALRRTPRVSCPARVCSSLSQMRRRLRAGRFRATMASCRIVARRLTRAWRQDSPLPSPPAVVRRSPCPRPSPAPPGCRSADPPAARCGYCWRHSAMCAW